MRLLVRLACDALWTVVGRRVRAMIAVQFKSLAGAGALDNVIGTIAAELVGKVKRPNRRPFTLFAFVHRYHASHGW